MGAVTLLSALGNPTLRLRHDVRPGSAAQTQILPIGGILDRVKKAHNKTVTRET